MVFRYKTTFLNNSAKQRTNWIMMSRVLLLTKKVNDAADFLTLSVLIDMILSLFSTIYFEFSGKHKRVCKYSPSCFTGYSVYPPNAPAKISTWMKSSWLKLNPGKLMPVGKGKLSELASSVHNTCPQTLKILVIIFPHYQRFGSFTGLFIYIATFPTPLFLAVL